MKMKNLILISLFIFSLIGCQRSFDDDVDFYKEGRPYKITYTCLDKHKKWTYLSLPNRYGPPTPVETYEWVCDRYRIDTIDIWKSIPVVAP